MANKRLYNSVKTNKEEEKEEEERQKQQIFLIYYTKTEKKENCPKILGCNWIKNICIFMY